jgi:DNA-binding XRE family transcriptional regulator
MTVKDDAARARQVVRDTAMAIQCAIREVEILYGTKRRRIYVAGPLSNGDVQANVDAAVDVGDKITELGGDPYVPHLAHYRHARHEHPYEFWIAEDLRWLSTCDAVYRMPGASRGADMEVVFAGMCGIPVFTDLEELAKWVRPGGILSMPDGREGNHVDKVTMDNSFAQRLRSDTEGEFNAKAVEVVGSPLKRLRIEKGLTRRQLSKKSGVFEYHIRDLEEGKVVPCLRVTWMLALALDMTTHDLLRELDPAKAGVPHA